MIGILIASALLSAAWQNNAINSNRAALVACLKQSIEQAKTQKIAADAYPAFAHQQCASQEAALKASIWAFDSKNKVSKRQSEEDAALQIEDYVATSAERYQMETRTGGSK